MAATIIDRHFSELVSPKQNSPDLEKDFEKFSERYRLFLDNDLIICITDNPLSHLSFMGPEIIDVLSLPVKSDNVMVHLNTFHRKTDERYDRAKEQNEQDLDIVLQHAAALGIKYLLCVSGDGSETLPRLQPENLGHDPRAIKTVTSVELLKYIRQEYAGRFTCGAAFNQYEPARDEMEKLKRKLEAGASFLITQPVSTHEDDDPCIAEANRNLEKMLAFADANKIQVILEAWMSQKFAHLIPQCVGYQINVANFDPWGNLKALLARYPERKIYFSMIFGAQTLKQVQAALVTA